MRTLLRAFVAVVFLCCSLLVMGQERDVNDLPRPEFHGLTQRQVSRRIFSREQAMIAKLGSLHAVTEAYMQSLGHRQRQGVDLTQDEQSESVIDDLYFLAAVTFGDDGPDERLLAGGGSWRNRYIQINDGSRDQVYPAGILMMFFVDLYSFDADRYSLMYVGRETVVNTDSLVFSVMPVKERDSGSFRGQIWVDASSFSIVRVKGVFAGPYERWFKALKGPERYFHFDSWREQVSNGWWLPSTTYFDERRTYHSDGNLEFHYRGYALFWQQNVEPAGDPQSKQSAAKNTPVVEGSSGASFRNALVARLEADGLLAAPGAEETRLNEIVQQIAPTSEGGMHKIECRVLLSTPVEMFAAGDSIIVSRGLLNLVSDDSVLAFLLARQVAHIVLGHAGSVGQVFPTSLFDLRVNKNFAGLGIRWKPEEEAAADSEAAVLLQGSPYKNGIANASTFLSQLNLESHRFPNLVRARFGVGVFPEGSSLPKREPKTMAQKEELQFENRYRVSWSRKIVDSKAERHAESTNREEPVAVQTSILK